MSYALSFVECKIIWGAGKEVPILKEGKLTNERVKKLTFVLD